MCLEIYPYIKIVLYQIFNNPRRPANPAAATKGDSATQHAGDQFTWRGRLARGPRVIGGLSLAAALSLGAPGRR